MLTAGAVPGGASETDGWWQLWREGVTTVLLVSDGQPWCHDVAAALADEGYAARIDGWRGPVEEADLPFDLVVVDLGGTGDPIGTITELRSRTTLPILAVVPTTAREVLVLDALAAGADQCVRGSAGAREVVARARSLLRRCPPRSRAVIDLRAGPLSVDLATGTALVMGVRIELTGAECHVLGALLRHPGRVVTRAALTRDASGAWSDRDLDAVVRRVRAKLEAVEGRRRISTVRGVGFRLEE